MPVLKQVVDVLETLYPLRYAESWDHPGLIVGDLSAPVRRIEFAADPTMEVVHQAIERGTDLLVCHHPLLFRSVHEVSGLGVHGDIVRRLSQAGCALWVGHTNADAAYRGTGMAAADLFGLVDQRPDSLFDEVRAAGVDVYVTSDLRHHPATDAIEQARYEAAMRGRGIGLGSGDAAIRPLLINTPHSAIESLWFHYALEDVPQAVERATGERPQVYWNRMNTDPWTLSIR